MRAIDLKLEPYIKAVVEDLAMEVDPDERVYPDRDSLVPLQADLREVIEGAVGDWQIEQREKHEVHRPPVEDIRGDPPSSHLDDLRATNLAEPQPEVTA